MQIKVEALGHRKNCWTGCLVGHTSTVS